MVSRYAALSTAFAAVAQANGGWGPWGGNHGGGHGGGQSPAVTVNVNPQVKHQIYDGIGISEAFQRSLVIHELNAESQALVLDYLFSNKTGAGMTILRNGLGSSPDQPFDLMKSIAPNKPASNSSQLDFIPLPREDQYQVWLAHQAIARGVKTVYADAWSADGYMKTNNTENYGGYLCGVTNATCASGDWRQSYANKIVKYLQDYKAEGIHIDYVGFLNEPDLNTTYASMQSNGQQAADFIKILYPTIKAAGLDTQIACCDGSGWEQARERITGIEEAGYENELGLTTAHGYSSYPGAPFVTTKKTWQTEWSTFDPINYNWYTAGGSQSDGIAWANRVQKLFTVSNVTGHLYWWGAANTTDNQSLLFVNNTAEVRVTGRLWAHVHYGSRFIRAGAHRIDASVAGSTALNVSAFANTDGSTAVQIINNSNNTETVALQGVQQTWGRWGWWGHGNKVKTYLTNNANNLTVGYAQTLPGGRAVASIPGQSLLSFVVS